MALFWPSLIMGTCQPRWLSGLTRSCVHSLWLLVDHCVLSNWDRILVRAVKGLISRAGIVSICPLLWQRDVKLQQTNIMGTSHWSVRNKDLRKHQDNLKHSNLLNISRYISIISVSYMLWIIFRMYHICNFN